jgi:RNA polymerase sigma-70 factor (ECF subfamily)
MVKTIRITGEEENISRAIDRAGLRDRPDVLALVGKATSGDIEAFGDLYTLYLNPIYRYVFYHVRDKMTAEDITEEVFIKAWKAIDSCKGKEHTFSSWLYRIAHNQMVDKLRSTQKRQAVEVHTQSLPETTDIERETEARLEWEQTLEAVSSLPRKQKQIIILKFVEGMDNREIERITGKSQNSIRVLQMRALSTLCQRLHKEG